MKIDFDANAIYNAALGKANNGEYLNALRLFAKTDGYESQLNRLGCLCSLNELFYASDLYRQIKSQYASTRNVYRDVKKLGYALEPLLEFADKKSGRRRADPSLKPADKSRLASYNGVSEMRDDEEPYYSELYEQQQPSPFVEVGSPEYFDRISAEMEKAYLSGNVKKAFKLADAVLDIDSDDAPTLETQILLCLSRKKVKEGVRYAEKLAELPVEELSAEGISAAVEMLTLEYSDKYRDSLAKLLNKALTFADELNPFDLDDCVYVSSELVKDRKTAYAFAEILYRKYREAGLQSLKKCAAAFHNCGDDVSAREALITLAEYVPEDVTVTVTLDYMERTNTVARFEVADKLNAHYAVPSVIAYGMQMDYLRRIRQEKFTADSGDFVALSALISYCKTLYIDNDKDMFFQTTALLKTVLHLFEPADKDGFVRFAERELSLLMPNPAISQELIARLVKSGCRDRVLIALEDDTYYYADLSVIEGADGVFADAFGICASLRATDTSVILSAYDSVCRVLGKPTERDDLQLSRKLAYCLMAVAYDGFPESAAADRFTDGEDEMYLQYLSKSAKV